MCGLRKLALAVVILRQSNHMSEIASVPWFRKSCCEAGYFTPPPEARHQHAHPPGEQLPRGGVRRAGVGGVWSVAGSNASEAGERELFPNFGPIRLPILIALGHHMRVLRSRKPPENRKCPELCLSGSKIWPNE